MASKYLELALSHRFLSHSYSTTFPETSSQRSLSLGQKVQVVLNMVSSADFTLHKLYKNSRR